MPPKPPNKGFLFGKPGGGGMPVTDANYPVLRLRVGGLRTTKPIIQKRRGSSCFPLSCPKRIDLMSFCFPFGPYFLSKSQRVSMLVPAPLGN